MEKQLRFINVDRFGGKKGGLTRAFEEAEKKWIVKDKLLYALFSFLSDFILMSPCMKKAPGKTSNSQYRPSKGHMRGKQKLA